jgi:chromate reductase
VVGTSTGLFGAVWAQAEARKVLSAIGARVIDRELPIGLADDAFHHEGGLTDEDQALALAGILAELAGEVPAATPVPAAS